MKRFIFSLSFCLVVAAPALAKSTGTGTGTAQTHHCVKDGATIEKTKKECKKEGGTWTKNDAKPADAKPPAGDKAEPAPQEK